MVKEIVLDMDGTWVDLYGVDGWLNDLINENTRPYEVARPLVNLSTLARVLNILKNKGYKIGVVSWCSKNSSKDFENRVREAKLKWIKKHIPSVKFDYINIVPYGTPKSTCGNGILFDDEYNNRNEWKGIAYSEKNLIKTLMELY